jgi:hypothetical protein
MPQNSVTSSPGSAIPDPDLIVIEKSGSSLFVQSSTTKTGALIENASVSNTNYSASLADDKPIFSPTYGEEKLSEDMGEIIFRDIAPSSFYYNASRYLALNKISV